MDTVMRGTRTEQPEQGNLYPYLKSSRLGRAAFPTSINALITIRLMTIFACAVSDQAGAGSGTIGAYLLTNLACTQSSPTRRLVDGAGPVRETRLTDRLRCFDSLCADRPCPAEACRTSDARVRQAGMDDQAARHNLPLPPQEHSVR
jgi:hypothetical protein